MTKWGDIECRKINRHRHNEIVWTSERNGKWKTIIKIDKSHGTRKRSPGRPRERCINKVKKNLQ